MRSALLIPLVMVAACAPAPRVPLRSGTSGAEAETLLLRAYPRLARRQGATLQVGRHTFVDKGECGGFATCERYRLDAVWPVQGYAGVVSEDGEYVGYELVPLRDGNAVSVGARPLFAPDGRHFAVATASESESHGDATGVEVWSAMQQRRVRTVEVSVAPYPELDGWRSSDCLAFTPNRLGQPRRNYFLVAGVPEWRLIADVPSPQCARS